MCNPIHPSFAPSTSPSSLLPAPPSNHLSSSSFNPTWLLAPSVVLCSVDTDRQKRRLRPMLAGVWLGSILLAWEWSGGYSCTCHAPCDQSNVILVYSCEIPSWSRPRCRSTLSQQYVYVRLTKCLLCLFVCSFVPRQSSSKASSTYCMPLVSPLC